MSLDVVTMDGFYGNQLSQEVQRQLGQNQQQHQHQQQQQQQQQRGQSNRQSDIPTSTSPDTPMMGADSLDDIIRENDQELQRRRSSITNPYAMQQSQGSPDRRLSMMEFGTSNNFSTYPFSPTTIAPQFQDLSMGNYGQSDMLSMGDMSPNMMGSMMPSDFPDMGMGQLGSDPSGMTMFQPQVDTAFTTGGMNTSQADFSMGMNADESPLAATSSTATGIGLDADDEMMNLAVTFANAGSGAQGQSSQQQQQQQQQQQEQQQQQQPLGNQSLQVETTRASLSKDTSREPSSQSINTTKTQQTTPQTSVSQSSAASTPIGPATPGGGGGGGGSDSKPKTVYSKSGFDMMRALWYVATRKNPTIHLGAVDMSCAFVVCDVTLNDCPIIYVSDNFQNLTGYSRHEIVGQNCRFLQAPDGKVEAGVKREFVDDAAVFNLKKHIAEGREVQQSLINYRKGGKPFLNLLTMIPIPWDTDEIRFFVGFQIDLVECPDVIASGHEVGGVKVNYKHGDIGQYIWDPPTSSQWEPESGQTLGMDDVSTLLQQFEPKGAVSDWHRQSWDKMLLENTDDVVHVLSLKGVFQYLSPSCKRVLEYDAAELVGSALSTVCHPSDIVPVTRELKDTAAGTPVNIVFRLRRKLSGYTWFESHGSLFSEQGKGRKCIILVGRKRPVFALSRRDLEANGGIGDSELWTKLSTSGMFLFVSSSIKSLLDLQPDNLVGTSIQDLMRKESRPEFGRAVEKARRGKIVSCKHEVTNKRGQVLQAQTVLYPGDARDGQKPTFLLAQTKLLKASSRAIAPATASQSGASVKSGTSRGGDSMKTVQGGTAQQQQTGPRPAGFPTVPGGGALAPGSQDAALASDDNIFGELRTTKCSSWQFELRQMEKVNRILAEELGGLLTNKKKRKRRKGVGNIARDCANCHTRNTPEWRRGPSGQRDLCNSCGLRWAKQTGRVSPRTSSRGGGNGDSQSQSQSKFSNSPAHSSPQHDGNAESGNAFGDDHGGSTPTGGNNNNGGSGSSSGNGSGNGGNKQSVQNSMPPPSQPLLEGGSGVNMTSIQEERETSTS